MKDKEYYSPEETYSLTSKTEITIIFLLQKMW